MLIPLLNQLRGRRLDEDSGAEDVQRSLADLGRACERLRQAGGRPAADGASAADVEPAAVEVLRHAVAVDRKLRPRLCALKLYYAVLWSRVRLFDDEDDAEGAADLEDPGAEELEDAIDGLDLTLWMLDACEKHIEAGLDGMGKSSVGRSPDGRVSARVDYKMRLVGLDCDPLLLQDPGYRASLIEAVNAAVEPVFRRRDGLMSSLLAGPEPAPERPDGEVGARAEAAAHVAEAFDGIAAVQEHLAQLLPRISRGEEVPDLEEEIDTVTDFIRKDAEELQRYLPVLLGCRLALEKKIGAPELGEADLAEVEGLEPLFLTDGLEDVEELVGRRGAAAAREVVEIATEEFQRQADDERDRRHWQLRAQRMSRRIAEVEQQSFDGRSRDGSVVAHAAGTVRLVDLELDAARLREPAGVEASVIEAVNAALESASRRRSSAMPLMVPQ